MKYKDITGIKYNKLTAMGYSYKKGKHIYYTFKCDCGVVKDILKDHVIREKTKSCGCYMVKRAIEINTKHGKRNTPEYKIWTGIKTRCLKDNYL